MGLGPTNWTLEFLRELLINDFLGINLCDY